MQVTRRYHFTVSFVLFAGVTVLLGIGAINSQNNLLFFAFGVALASLIASGFVSGSALRRGRLRRSSVGEAYVGMPLRIVYEAEHRGRGLPAFALLIEELRRGPLGAGEKPTWPESMEQPRAFLAFVGRGRLAHAEAEVVPTRRGRFSLGPMRITTSFPFGAVRKSVSFLPTPEREGWREVIVRPALVEMPDSLRRRVARRSLEAANPARHRGEGDEFFGLREYVAGDSVRRVAWRASARTGDLMVREHAAHDSSRVIVAVRLSRQTPGPARDSADERAISLAASAIVHSARSGVEVGLSIPAADTLLEPRAGDAYAASLLDALAVVDLASPALDRHATVGDLAVRDAVVVVDADDPSLLGDSGGDSGGALPGPAVGKGARG